jgi:hypothetical protein
MTQQKKKVKKSHSSRTNNLTSNDKIVKKNKIHKKIEKKNPSQPWLT